MNHTESNIQIACVRWFHYQFPNEILFAVPNGGHRNRVTAAILKAEGVLAGTPDLILMAVRGNYGMLCIEMKTPKGRQSDSQKWFQGMAEAKGYKYVICRSFEEFRNEIKEYLK